MNKREQRIKQKKKEALKHLKKNCSWR